MNDIKSHNHDGINSVKLNFNSDPIAGKMYASSAQATTDSISVVQLNNNSLAVDITADTANYRFTVVNPGYYYIMGQVAYAAPVADKSYNAFIYKNNSLLTRGTGHSSNTDSISVTTSNIIYLIAGDYIDLRCGQNSGSSVNTRVGTDDTFLLIHKI